jgi:hypothetical protein
MKPRRSRKWFGALLLVGLLTSGFESHALPPRQHAARGVIESVDLAKRTLVLVEAKTKTSRTFVWNDSTRFRQDGKKVTPGTLQVGITVRGYYRKEVGRFVLRELRWSNTAPRSSETATQHNPENAPLQAANNPKKP